MKLIGKIKNGNYWKAIFEDGTIIKYNKLDNLIPEYPDSMDVKITNKCDMGCKFCHENSKPDGEHGDIMNAKFIETLLPYTELAIGGGNPLEHPDLIPFLEKCKKLKLIPNMTVNQKHFMENYDLLAKLIENKLIYGLGVSLTNPDQEHFIELIKQYPTAVIHVINGVHSVETLKKLYDNNLKLLILGYKDFRRGETYHNELVDKNKKDLYDELSELTNHFDVVSFDNLALKQLEPKRLLSDEEWNQTYMGEDGQHTLFIDLVAKTYSVSSTSPLSERYELKDNIKDMFNHIRQLKSN